MTYRFFVSFVKINQSNEISKRWILYLILYPNKDLTKKLNYTIDKHVLFPTFQVNLLRRLVSQEFLFQTMTLLRVNKIKLFLIFFTFRLIWMKRDWSLYVLINIQVSLLIWFCLKWPWILWLSFILEVYIYYMVNPS